MLARMFELENHASVVAAVVVQRIPGPGTLAIVNATARGGGKRS
jgi:threonine/homoserine/homoserine lactone efflux protein